MRLTGWDLIANVMSLVRNYHPGPVAMSLPRRLFRLILQFIGLLTLLGLLAALIALPLLPRILQVEDKIKKADYILVVSGDWSRYFRAAELYKEGFAPKVLVSNAYVRPPSRFNKTLSEMGIEVPPRHELRDRLMVHLGIPADATEVFGDGHISTAEEAEALRDFLAEKRLGKSPEIILVTSPYHTRRAKLIFSDTLPDVHFTMTAPPEKRIKSQWWRDRDSAIRSVLELFKFGYYLIGGRFRSDPSTS